MPWCNHCQDYFPVGRDPDTDCTFCSGCGKVLHEDFFSNAVTFEKTSDGQSRLSGTIQRLGSEYSMSRERTLYKGREEISFIVNGLSMSGGDSIINPAHNLYRIAVERGFTKGRSTTQIAASCLYIACRQHAPVMPYLLIDFSNYLQINVYVLGAVFLQLCRLLCLEEHPIVQKPIDPSLFMNRFTQCLLGSDNKKVTRTALNILASMKRDWMQTGRKPNGLCGAALYIAVHSHQIRHSKAEIVNVVHICEATLTKRLIEFENTEAAGMTIEELDEKAKELREQQQSQPQGNSCKDTELLCQHKDKSRSHYAHGLCKECYDEFIEISGGLDGGSEPPAFQRAEMQRKMEAEKKAIEFSQDAFPHELEAESNNNIKEKTTSGDDINRSATENVLLTSNEHEISGCTTTKTSFGKIDHDGSVECEVNGDEPESLSDIDDFEVDGYLHTEEEKHYKKIIWEEMNKEYLEELAAKEAAAAAARQAYEANFANDPEGLRAARELVETAAAAAAQSRKEKRLKRAEEARKAGPAKTAAEATSQLLKRKTFSSKINYEALNSLYNNDDENVKKQHLESEINVKSDEQLSTKKEKKQEDDELFGSEFAADDNAADTFYGDEYGGGDYGEEYNFGNDDDCDFY